MTKTPIQYTAMLFLLKYYCIYYYTNLYLSWYTSQCVFSCKSRVSCRLSKAITFFSMVVLRKYPELSLPSQFSPKPSVCWHQRKIEKYKVSESFLSVVSNVISVSQIWFSRIISSLDCFRLNSLMYASAHYVFISVDWWISSTEFKESAKTSHALRHFS